MIVFYIYAWRYYIRYAQCYFSQKNELPRIIDYQQENFKATLSKDVIESFWELLAESQDKLGHEKFLQNTFDNISKDEILRNDESLRDRIIADFYMHDYEAPYNEYKLILEWKLLGLIDENNKPKNSLKYLLKWINEDLIGIDRIEESTIINLHSKLIEIIQKRFDQEKSTEFNKILQNLHTGANFPIINYYYQLIFDKNDTDNLDACDEKRPFDILIIPVWDSKTIRDILPWENKQIVTSRYVISLISINAIENIEENVESCDGYFQEIKNLILTIFQAAIDKYLYQILTRYFNDTRELILKNRLGNIINRNSAHHIESHISYRCTLDKILERVGWMQSSTSLIDKVDLSDFQSNSISKNTITRLYQMLNQISYYKSERTDFIAGLETNNTNTPIIKRFYEEIILPFAENSLIMDNIARSEGICFGEKDKIALNNDDVSKLRIRVFYSNNLNIKQYKGYDNPELQNLKAETNCTIPLHAAKNYMNNVHCTTKNLGVNFLNTNNNCKKPENTIELCEEDLGLENYHEICAFYKLSSSNTNFGNIGEYICIHELPYYRSIIETDSWYIDRKFNCDDIKIVVPGSLGSQSFYSILENFIRNTVKHSNRELLDKASNVDIIIKIDLKNEFYYEIEITSNIPTFETKERIKDGKLTPFANIIKSCVSSLESNDTTLGIADIRINANLLAFKPITNLSLNSIISIPKPYERKNTREIIPEQFQKLKYSLRIQFDLTKPCSVIFIGKEYYRLIELEKLTYNKAGIFAYETSLDCISKLTNSIKLSFELAVIESSVFDEFFSDSTYLYDGKQNAKSWDKLFSCLPWRIIVTENNEEKAISDKVRFVRDSKRVIYTSSQVIRAGDGKLHKPSDLLDVCWQLWLKDRYGPDRKYVLSINLQQQKGEIQSERYIEKSKSANKDLLYIDVAHQGYTPTIFNDIRINELLDRSFIFYDRHGSNFSDCYYNKIEMLGGDSSDKFIRNLISHNSAWFELGKVNKDFDLIFNDTLSNDSTTLYKLVESGIHKILIIDERIREFANAESQGLEISPGSVSFFSGNGPNSIFFQCLAANIFVADSFVVNNNEALFLSDRKNNQENYIQVSINNSGITFNGLLGSQMNELQIDTLIIHRTMLNKVIESDYNLFNHISKEFPNILVCTGGGVLSYDPQISARIRKTSYFSIKSFLSDHGIAKNCLINLL